jgi:hypothetical protein
LGLRSVLYMNVSTDNFMCLILELAAAYYQAFDRE